jgi:hypothetical protein
MPTSTDLVTDLPADFEVFGQAVDTALVDLKGGTTGQVLSKASNTNMDFTWVTTDDANAIQNSIVDAKGDIVAASAADTPARLGVGTNGKVLTAVSGETTGLKWADAGLTYITGATFSAVSTFSLPNNTFTATYRNYRIICTVDSFPTSSGAVPLVLQMRAAGVNNTSSNYYYARGFFYPSTAGATGGLGIYAELVDATAPNGGYVVIDVLSPFVTEKTQLLSQGLLNQNGNLPIGGMCASTLTVTTSYDSLTIATSGSNTMTGNYRVYGYGENYA